jgi:hypothetical protein
MREGGGPGSPLGQIVTGIPAFAGMTDKVLILQGSVLAGH